MCHVKSKRKTPCKLHCSKLNYYLYANSMQTAQRRIPIGGDNGKMKTWAELLLEYEKELKNLKKNISMLKAKAAGTYKEKIGRAHV